MTTTLTENQDLRLRAVDPAADAALLHDWVVQERAVFWGMGEKDRDEVEEIYTWIVEQPHLAAYLLEIDGDPVALFQTYDPEVDDIGQFYDRLPGDLGVHLLLADHPARAGRTTELVMFLFDWLFHDPGTRRLVLEPDARNTKSLDLLGRLGARNGPRVEFPHKPAQFVFLTRDDCLREHTGLSR
jgi:RimJ/RimL family protein N-acetyltransferase